ncbi:MAG TPA: metal-dependent transcriptional regulator [Candidatus Lokiarchaeia archaeon]|nr:metal-dependent transcriptional regulator [Candidatus Lokiarchaeia archaeon]
MMETPEPGTLDYQILMQFLSNQISIRPGELSEQLQVRHPTINSALKRMEQDGYLTWKHYGGIKLTDKGMDALKHVEIHHHLIEVFLVDSLGLTPEEAHEESLALAPFFSCVIIKKICDKYKNPEFCPSNEKIPDLPSCHTHGEQ